MQARGWSWSHGSPKVGAPEPPRFAATARGKKPRLPRAFPCGAVPRVPRQLPCDLRRGRGRVGLEGSQRQRDRVPAKAGRAEGSRRSGSPGKGRGGGRPARGGALYCARESAASTRPRPPAPPGEPPASAWPQCSGTPTALWCAPPHRERPGPHLAGALVPRPCERSPRTPALGPRPGAPRPSSRGRVGVGGARGRRAERPSPARRAPSRARPRRGAGARGVLGRPGRLQEPARVSAAPPRPSSPAAPVSLSSPPPTAASRTPAPWRAPSPRRGPLGFPHPNLLPCEPGQPVRWVGAGGAAGAVGAHLGTAPLPYPSPEWKPCICGLLS